MSIVMTIEEREARLDEIKQRLEEIDREYQGGILPAELRTEWNSLVDERKEQIESLKEQRARRTALHALNGDEDNSERGADFHTGRSGVARGGDIWDLSTIRVRMDSPEEASRELRDRALRAVEQVHYPHERADEAHIRQHLRHLLDTAETQHGDLARHLLTTGSPMYQRAFAKAVSNRPVKADEQMALARALSLTGASGGFAVPFTLDPTVIPTSNLSVNPYRRISRVEAGVTDDWKGVSSAGVTAAYAAEATEASDNAPTLAQPAVSSEKAFAFVPFSIEIGMDWNSLQAEMARLFQDAKDDLEATKFTAGSGTNEPFGVVTGATTLVTSAGTAAFAVADVYAMESALGPRFRPRAEWIGNRFYYNKVRQFDTSGGANLWMPLPAPLREGLANDVPRGGNTGAQLIGYPANESSAMSSSLATGQKGLILGDFSYFLIYDRIGMTVELIPHLFGVSQRPTGQRGLYAYWRNGAKVLDANAFRTLNLL